MAEIVVIARARARAGKEDDLRKLLDAVMPPTHQESGCSRYALHRGLDDRATFVMVERYKSKSDLDQHMGTSYIQNLFARIGDVVDGPPELLFLEPLTDAMGEKARI